MKVEDNHFVLRQDIEFEVIGRIARERVVGDIAMPVS
jgi:hypothetical protein